MSTNNQAKGVPPPPPVPTEDDLHKVLPTELEAIEGKEWFSLALDGANSANIHGVDWGKAVGFAASEEGSEGILFVQFSDKSVVTVKGSSTVAGDVFAMELALLAHTLVPKYRVLRRELDREYKVLVQTLNRLDERNNPISRNKHQKAIDHPVILLLEFIPNSKQLCDLGPAVFGGATLSDQGAAIIEDIGKIIIFDVVINNWDRIPLLWDNNGNPDNILFTAMAQRFYPIAIDNTVTSIDPQLEENFSEYLDKVRYIINEMCVRMGMPKIFLGVRATFKITCYEKQPGIENVVDFLRRTTQCKVVTGEQSIKSLLSGLIEGMNAFSKITPADLQHIHDSVQLAIGDCLPKTNIDILYKVNLNFLNAVLEVLKTGVYVLGQHKDVKLANEAGPAQL